MRFEVLLTEDAERDLADIYTSIAEHDWQNADYVLDRLLEVTDSLATAPERGLLPRELAALGIQEYRQVFFKPYPTGRHLCDRRWQTRCAVLVIAQGFERLK